MSRLETQSPDSNNVSSTTSTIASQNDNTNVPLINMSINNIMQKLPGVESILLKDNTKNPPHSAFSNPSTSSPSSSLSSMPMGQPPQLPPISNKLSIQNQLLLANSKSLSNEFATMESALVFLANAAGEIAKADERDNIDAQSKYDQIEASLSGANSHRVSIDESMIHQQQQEQLHPHYQQKLQQNHHHHKPPQQELHHLQP